MGKRARARVRQEIVDSVGQGRIDAWRLARTGVTFEGSAYDGLVQRLALGDPLGALGALGAAREGLDNLAAQAVLAALVTGSSWLDVGSALGVSKQAAHQRWAVRSQQLLNGAVAQVEQEPGHERLDPASVVGVA